MEFISVFDEGGIDEQAAAEELRRLLRNLSPEQRVEYRRRVAEDQFDGLHYVSPFSRSCGCAYGTYCLLRGIDTEDGKWQPQFKMQLVQIGVDIDPSDHRSEFTPLEEMAMLIPNLGEMDDCDPDEREAAKQWFLEQIDAFKE